jgi:hypothetical protein
MKKTATAPFKWVRLISFMGHYLNLPSNLGLPGYREQLKSLPASSANAFAADPALNYQFVHTLKKRCCNSHRDSCLVRAGM